MACSERWHRGSVLSKDYPLSYRSKGFIQNIGKHKPDDSSNKFSFGIPEKYEVNYGRYCETTGAPVVVERNPSQQSFLISNTEQRIFVVADHLFAGSVHRARGGYLILEVEEILAFTCMECTKKLITLDIPI